MAESFPYQVQYGYCCREHTDFATFELALAFYRGYLESGRQRRSDPERLLNDDGPRLVNTDNIDGAEDSSAASQHGLTTEEWDRVQEVG